MSAPAHQAEAARTRRRFIRSLSKRFAEGDGLETPLLMILLDGAIIVPIFVIMLGSALLAYYVATGHLP